MDLLCSWHLLSPFDYRMYFTQNNFSNNLFVLDEVTDSELVYDNINHLRKKIFVKTAYSIK